MFNGMQVHGSSVISSAYYHGGPHEMLILEFTSGKKRVYRAVPYDVFLALLRAPSPGRYYNQEIKGLFDSLPYYV